MLPAWVKTRTGPQVYHGKTEVNFLTGTLLEQGKKCSSPHDLAGRGQLTGTLGLYKVLINKCKSPGMEFSIETICKGYS